MGIYNRPRGGTIDDRRQSSIVYGVTHQCTSYQLVGIDASHTRWVQTTIVGGFVSTFIACQRTSTTVSLEHYCTSHPSSPILCIEHAGSVLYIMTPLPLFSYCLYIGRRSCRIPGMSINREWSEVALSMMVCPLLPDNQRVERMTPCSLVSHACLLQVSIHFASTPVNGTTPAR